MATETQVRKYLDPEEPDYPAAAAALGVEALPVLETLVQRGDPLLASKAAYLASLIPHEHAARVLEQAAQSDHPTVRIAAAAGLQRHPEVSSDVTGFDDRSRRWCPKGGREGGSRTREGRAGVGRRIRDARGRATPQGSAEGDRAGGRARRRFLAGRFRRIAGWGRRR